MVKHRKSKSEANEKTENKTTGELQDEMNETGKETAPAAEPTAEEVIAELNNKYNELNDKFLRLYSEFDNYRKRMIREKAELSKTASEEIILSLLPVLDDLERAISSFAVTDSADPLKEGTQLIYNKLKNNLQQKGLQETEAMGMPFDTDYHEAIANVQAPDDAMKNKIINVTQKGYSLNGKVIRFAKVVVGN